MDNQVKCRKSPGRRVLELLLKLLAGSYLGICLGLAIYQRRLIYVPTRFSVEEADARARAAGLERWRDAAGQAIGFKRRSPHQPAAGQVLLFHGNGGSAVGVAHYAGDIQSAAALDVYILEYPGYGDRDGSPTEQHLDQAAGQALPLLATNLPVYLVGESLGTGVASWLAGAQPDRIAGVALLSPFDRLASAAGYRYPFVPARLLLLDRFPSVDNLTQYHGPLAVMLDGADNIVPDWSGQRLYDRYAGPKQLWEFPQNGHVSLGEPPSRFWRDVVKFWQTGGKT